MLARSRVKQQQASWQERLETEQSPGYCPFRPAISHNLGEMQMGLTALEYPNIDLSCRIHAQAESAGQNSFLPLFQSTAGEWGAAYL
jgi:hypothetical protein